jgi:hypothetical protein
MLVIKEVIDGDVFSFDGDLKQVFRVIAQAVRVQGRSHLQSVLQLPNTLVNVDFGYQSI